MSTTHLVSAFVNGEDVSDAPCSVAHDSCDGETGEEAAKRRGESSKSAIRRGSRETEGRERPREEVSEGRD